ncbi:MAG: acetyl-CoA decarbonylase/synthase complex subunit alpha [Crenarchaeota archaeon]|nr:acetyl-CoA decarbonylase/synthase complex subunit alpha [Thermoproteota archaeon]
MTSGVKVKIDEASQGSVTVRGLEVTIGEVVEESEKWSPPDVLDLRLWDVLLVSRYAPKIVPGFVQCALCTFGPCDLTKMSGTCGIDAVGNHVRILTLAVALGLGHLVNRARKMYKLARRMYEPETEISISPEITIPMPNVSLITGLIPKKLKDLEKVLDYISGQDIKTLDSVTVFREFHPLDLASRMLHTGMLSHIACEITDTLELMILKRYGIEMAPEFRKFRYEINVPEKPTILYIGESCIPLLELRNVLKKMDLGEPGEVVDILAASCNVVNIPGVQYIGPPLYAVPLLRLGYPDVVIIDDTCVSANIVKEASKSGSIIISVTDSTTFLLPPIEDTNVEQITKSGGCTCLDYSKAARLSIMTAIRVHGRRAVNTSRKLDVSIDSLVEKCDLCGKCVDACPYRFNISSAIDKLKKGDSSEIGDIASRCVWCGRCEEVCPQKIEIMTILARHLSGIEIGVNTRAPPLTDQIIRSIGAPIVLGEIPGVIAFVGCPNMGEHIRDIAKIVEELAKRGFIVLASGCVVELLGKYKSEEGSTLYEEYGELGRGCIVNVGPCTALSEVSGIAIRVANIFAGRKIKGNYEEIADYILNRVGACGIGWGAATHKILSIAVGFLRLGVPIIVGPQCGKLGILLEGVEPEKFVGIDMKTGKQVYAGPAPQHLLYLAKTPEECLIMAIKLCIRPGDTSKGRAIKLSHYIDLYKKFYGTLPPDVHYYVRTEADIPITYREELMKHLEKVGWKPWEYVSTDLTISERVYRQLSSKK